MTRLWRPNQRPLYSCPNTFGYRHLLYRRVTIAIARRGMPLLFRRCELFRHRVRKGQSDRTYLNYNNMTDIKNYYLSLFRGRSPKWQRGTCCSTWLSSINSLCFRRYFASYKKRKDLTGFFGLKQPNKRLYLQRFNRGYVQHLKP